MMMLCRFDESHSPLHRTVCHTYYTPLSLFQALYNAYISANPTNAQIQTTINIVKKLLAQQQKPKSGRKNMM